MANCQYLPHLRVTVCFVHTVQGGIPQPWFTVRTGACLVCEPPDPGDRVLGGGGRGRGGGVTHSFTDVLFSPLTLALTYEALVGINMMITPDLSLNHVPLADDKTQTLEGVI